MLSHRAKVVLRPAYAPASLQSFSRSTCSQPWFRLCALWKHCLLASASMFLGLRHVTILLLCNLATLQWYSNLATLQWYSCSTTKRCRPSLFQRRAQNVNHPRHRCDFGKWLYLIDRSLWLSVADIIPVQYEVLQGLDDRLLPVQFKCWHSWRASQQYRLCLGLRYVTVLLLCNLATLQLHNSSITKHYVMM